MTVLEDGPGLRKTVATACRILAARGLVQGTLGHVSARVGENELVIRCRGPRDPGLFATGPEDVWRLTLDGEPVDVPDGHVPPKELPLHAELLRARPDLSAVVHAHPRSALLCGLANLEPRAVFGAYNIPAARMARAGVPVYDRPVLVSRPDLGREVARAMRGGVACILRGHGVVVGGATVQQATVRTLDLDVLCGVTVELARLDAVPPELTEADWADLPDLGASFNDARAWAGLVAELGGEQG